MTQYIPELRGGFAGFLEPVLGAGFVGFLLFLGIWNVPVVYCEAMAVLVHLNFLGLGLP